MASDGEFPIAFPYKLCNGDIGNQYETVFDGGRDAAGSRVGAGKFMRALFIRFLGLFFQERRDRELQAEIDSNLALHIDDNLRSGMAPGEARRNALLKFGGRETMKEAYRDRRSLPWIDSAGQDLRYAWRMIWKSPGFAAVVALTLSLGIGANTAIFSVVKAALTPLAIPDPAKVVMVWSEDPKRGWRQLPASVPDYLAWSGSDVFSALGAYREAGFNLRQSTRIDRVEGMRVTPEFFGALVGRPQLGRCFLAEDMQGGNAGVVMLSDKLWRSRFGADPGIAGKNVVLDGTSHVIVGVLPPRFPQLEHEEIYTPFVFDAQLRQDRKTRNIGVLGRLRPGITLAAAQQRMAELSASLGKQFEDNTGITAVLQPAEEAFVEDARTLLAILLGAVGFVLLIACANITNLLLARGTARRKEIAVRAALGAGRARLLRQLLTESMLLAVLAGILGVVPALLGIRLVASLHLEDLPNMDLIVLNVPVLLFNFAMALLAGVLIGIAPAWQVARTDVNDSLKESCRSVTSADPQRMRAVLVIAQLSLTLILLAGGSLLLQSFWRMRSASPGYSPAGILTMKIGLSGQQYPTGEKQVAFYEKVLERVQRLPGVIAASATDALPESGDVHGTGLYFPGQPIPRPKDVPIVLQAAVTPGYFQAMQLPLIRGRYFQEQDRRVVIIDEWTAQHYWPGGNPIGQLLKLKSKLAPREIVGVVRPVGQSLLVKMLKGQLGQVYVPFSQEPRGDMTLAIRTAGDPAALASAVRAAVSEVDVEEPVFQVRTMESLRAANHASLQLAAWLMAGFAVVAFLLATIGLYGVIAFQVGQRTREFSIRASLGATGQDLLQLVLGRSLALITIGIALGLAGALTLSRLLSGLLYEARPADMLLVLGMAAALGSVAMVASAVPARKAARIDPVIALRND
jgi:predicted permease